MLSISPFLKSSTFAVWLAGAAVLFAGFACWIDHHGVRVLATVLSIQGDAVFGNSKEIDHNPRSVSITSRLRVGDQLRTNQDAKILLCPVPGIFVEVDGQTDLRIEELRLAKQGNAMVRAIKWRLAVLRLNKGVVRASLSNPGPGRCELRIKTEAGTFLPRQGSLSMLETNGTTVRVTCAQGKISWKNAQDNSIESIPAGYFQTYGSAAETERRVRPASDDARAQSEIAGALEFAVSLRNRESSMRDAQSPWRDR